MSEINLVFDRVLCSMNENDESDINPLVYVAKYCELLKNQVDLYESMKELDGKYSNDEHIKLINEIEQFEIKCIENCRQNFDHFSERLKIIMQSMYQMKNKSRTKRFLEKTFEIRIESTKLRQDIFKRNLIFLEKVEGKEIGSLVFIEPYCLDDFQIETLK